MNCAGLLIAKVRSDNTVTVMSSKSICLGKHFSWYTDARTGGCWWYGLYKKNVVAAKRVIFKLIPGKEKYHMRFYNTSVTITITITITITTTWAIFQVVSTITMTTA